MSGHRDRPAQHGTRGRRTEADDDARPQARELQFEPRLAGLDLAEPWLGVQAALAARFPLEVFHRVREIHVRPLDASRRQRRLRAGLVECRAFREPGGRVEAIWHVGAVSARAGRP